MTEHVADDLPRLISGEATRDEVHGAAVHLPGCPDCQQELISIVVAHAGLASAQRFAPELIRTATGPAPELPDLGGLLDDVRSEPRRRRRLVTAAAAAAVVLAGGTAAGIVASSGGSAGHRVALAAYGTGTVPASATFSGDRLRVDAAALPALSSNQRYEVWLTDAARTRMQPVGWIGTDGHAAVTVPADLKRTFSDIEVSVQHIDAQKYDYSGTSVLRGAYAG